VLEDFAYVWSLTALQIDKKTGTDFWKKAIGEEMLNVQCAFEEKESLTLEKSSSVFKRSSAI